MTIQVTADDVFDLMGTGAANRAANRLSVENLIARFYADTESVLGRKIQATTITTTFWHGKGCIVDGCKLHFMNHLRDVKSISSFTECGLTLTQSTTYGDNKDFVLNDETGCLERVYGYWSTQRNAFVMTAVVGLVGDDLLMLPDIKQYIAERVAYKSGLWISSMQNSDGTLDTFVRTSVPKETMNMRDKYLGSRNV
jgi:hypothetical protein